MNTPTKDTLAYVAPFACWIGLQTILPATALSYAVRTLITACVALLAWHHFAWRGTSFSSLRPWLTGLSVGIFICILWIVPDFSTFYRTWLCWPFGSLPAVSGPSPYDPTVCGWPLTILKLIGSAFVIAPLEEVFFRSFLYRWIQNADFQSVNLSHFDASAFIWTVGLFTLEHDRPLVAALCGCAYGLLAIRCGLFAAILAHITTNLLLALFVIQSGMWNFW